MSVTRGAQQVFRVSIGRQEAFLARLERAPLYILIVGVVERDEASILLEHGLTEYAATIPIQGERSMSREEARHQYDTFSNGYAR